ncbi:flagellar basal-body rod modification protein FlgD [Marivita geojedonensis]|nr:FlgD immunoglobulin-like domain containing protein [Marivita geojedonensis]PRY73824.1 flagellar basal-body rod modification protein FlgD [Marivita geojedonensis]
MEADQFASQLATFSMVEQQTLTNQNLEALISSISAGGLPGYASLVGRVAVHDQAFQFSGAPVELEIKNEIFSSDTKIVILDDSGNVVAEIELGSGQFKATWDGTGLEGRLLASALYSAEVWRVSDDFHTETTVTTQAVIEEVRFDGGEATLILSDGTEISEDRVNSFR